MRKGEVAHGGIDVAIGPYSKLAICNPVLLEKVQRGRISSTSDSKVSINCDPWCVRLF